MLGIWCPTTKGWLPKGRGPNGTGRTIIATEESLGQKYRGRVFRFPTFLSQSCTFHVVESKLTHTHTKQSTRGHTPAHTPAHTPITMKVSILMLNKPASGT